MKKYINTTIFFFTIDCNIFISVSILDGYASDDKDILVKEELTDEDIYKICLDWDF